MMTLDFLLSAMGVLVFLWRVRPWAKEVDDQTTTRIDTLAGQMISIIVPCRNEADHVQSVVKSLMEIQWDQKEIIVVDDGSTDETYALAKAIPGITVLRAPPKPECWVGKSWACHHGALLAQGTYLLFTDADTRHDSKSFARISQFGKPADLLSAPPYHLCENIFERFLGFFQMLPMVAAPLFSRQKTSRLFAIGQFLLFRREVYFRIGGHQSVARSLVEDLDLAKKIISAGYIYEVYPWATLYSVQMYGNFREFCLGWKRLIRLGMRKSSFMAYVELILVIFPFVVWSWVSLPAIFLVAWGQRRYGRFHILGAPLAPLSVGLFSVLSVWGLIESLLGFGVNWRGRVYSGGRQCERG